MIKEIKKLIEFRWEMNGDINDENVSLRRTWNLLEVVGGEFDSNGNLTETEYIIFPYSERVFFTTWIKGQPECCNNSVEEELNYIWKQALNDDLFTEVEFPEFEILIDSGNELNYYPYYDLVQLNENFSNTI